MAKKLKTFTQRVSLLISDGIERDLAIALAESNLNWLSKGSTSLSSFGKAAVKRIKKPNT